VRKVKAYAEIPWPIGRVLAKGREETPAWLSKWFIMPSETVAVSPAAQR
jgi:hypothetical protein